MIINPSAPQVPLAPTITVRELVDKLHDATSKMSVMNPHRALMLHAMSAIMQLVKYVDDGEYPAAGRLDASDRIIQ